MFSHHRTLRSARQKRRRRNRFRARMAALALFFCAFLGGLSYFFHTAAFTISAVRVEGATVADQDALERTVETILSGKYFWFFPKRNFFLYPKGTLEKSLLDSFKQLEALKIRTPDFKTLVVSVVLRTPHALWCGTRMKDAGEAEASACYFMDERGLLFAQAPSFSGDLYFTYYGDIGKGEAIGSRLLQPDRFRNLDAFLTSLRTLGLSPVALDIDGSDGAIRLKKGDTILVSLKDDFGRTLQNLQSFLAGNARAVSSGEMAAVASFRSIDLRFGNKIFFKRR